MVQVMKYIIETENVDRDFPIAGREPVKVLKKVSVKIPEKSLTILRGPSGSGKTTLMNIIGALDRPTEGRYSLKGTDVCAAADAELSDGGWPLSGSGDTSLAAFKTYLKAYMDCVPEMNGHEEELYGLIDAESWAAPVAMAWENWFEENAMTYDEFVAANGEYSLHLFGVTSPPA